MLLRRIARLVSKNGGPFDQFKDIKEEKLNERDISDQLKSNKLNDWKFDKISNRITKRVSTKDLNNRSSELLQSINFYAQRIGAKPDFVTGYDYVEISVSSPALQGVSQKDVGLASAIDRLEQKHREHVKNPKGNYRCELSAEDETDIYNNVKGRKDNATHGSEVKKDHEAQERERSSGQSGYGQSDSKVDRNRSENKDAENVRDRNTAQSFFSNSKSAEQQTRGYGQSNTSAIKDDKQNYNKQNAEKQPQGPSYRGGSNYEEPDGKQGADGYDYQNENRQNTPKKSSADQKQQSKQNPNYTQKDASQNAYQSAAESKYGSGSKTDQGVRNNSKSDGKDKDSSNASKKQENLTGKTHNDDPNEYPHSHKDDTGHKDRNNKGPKGSSYTPK